MVLVLVFLHNKKTKKRMNLKGLAAAIGTMVVVTMFRMGQKPTFNTAAEEARYVKQVADQVKEANKALKAGRDM